MEEIVIFVIITIKILMLTTIIIMKLISHNDDHDNKDNHLQREVFSS